NEIAGADDSLPAGVDDIRNRAWGVTGGRDCTHLGAFDGDFVTIGNGSGIPITSYLHLGAVLRVVVEAGSLEAFPKLLRLVEKFFFSGGHEETRVRGNGADRVTTRVREEHLRNSGRRSVDCCLEADRHAIDRSPGEPDLRRQSILRKKRK